MLRVTVFASAALASSLVFAQNIATVNSKPVPKAREDAWVQQLVSQGQKDSPQLREMVKKELVRREVFMQEIAKRGLAEKPDVKFQLDVQRQNTLIQALMRDELQKTPVTDAQIRAEYDKQKAAAGAKEYKARHILVEKEDDAKSIVDQLKKGAKFEDLAKQSKDTGSAARGGDLDWAPPDAYVKPFSDAMVKLEKGKFTDAPVQSQFGWHVIRLDDVRDMQFPPFEQVQGQLREKMQQERAQEFVARLEKAAKIQ
jgi:peptidyl-prolyl cis-trans isomerase C